MKPINTEEKSILNQIGRDNGSGGCQRCGDCWNWKKSHDTVIDKRRGYFVLCEECWIALTPSERLPFYKKMFSLWPREDRPLVTKAVLEGR